MAPPSCRDGKSLFTDEIVFGKDHSQKWQRRSLAAPSCRDVKSLFTDKIVFGKDKSKVIARNGNVEVWQHPVVVKSSCSSRMKLFSEKIVARNVAKRRSLAAPSRRDVKSLFMDEIVFGKDKSKLIARNGNEEIWQHPVVVTASRSSRMK